MRQKAHGTGLATEAAGVCVRSNRQAGFSMIELLTVMATAVTLIAVAVPAISGFLRSQRALTAARLVERQLQAARLKAVSSSHSLRVRFNCPVAGQVRTLEFTGVSSTDNASNRCDPVVYPSPGPKDTQRSTPSLDSPVVYLPSGSTVTGTSLFLEFTPKGTVYTVGSGGVVTALNGDLTLTVTRAGFSKTVTINALGRVRLN